MKYFHEATDEELEELIANKTTIGELEKLYAQPDWCNYPGALQGVMGCWSLTDIKGLRKSISLEYCKGCECCHPKVENLQQRPPPQE